LCAYQGADSRWAQTTLTRTQPVHWVRVSSFWLGETAVTNQQYEVFLRGTDRREPLCWQDQRFAMSRNPVVGVSWHDAVAFCDWLSERHRFRYFLPSEAQWEFAAKGTDFRLYPWGNEAPDDTRALFGEDSGRAPSGLVDLFPAGKGPFGTLGQAGNVWEWCQDVWDGAAYKKRKDKETVDPIVSGSDDVMRSVRGGSHWSGAGYLRCAFRFRFHAENQYPDLGFRVAAK
jgi:iron(II)-dependent oxidoreductase